MVELRMELRLILLAAGDEHVRVLGRQDCLDGVPAPHLTAVRLAPAPPVVSVDGLVSAGTPTIHTGLVADAPVKIKKSTLTAA
jgi:hypothetical protein